MDPQVTWNDLITAYKQQAWPEVEQAALDLLQWLLRGGFPPDTGGNRMTPEEHATAARDFCIFACAAALAEQQDRLDVAKQIAGELSHD